MGKHYSEKFKTQVLNDYKTGNYGGYIQVAKKYGISHGTLSNWIYKEKRQGNLDNDIHKKNINYKERYEILKKYQAFLKAQRERK